MKVLVPAVAIVVCAGVVGAATPADPAAWLAQARAAMGGTVAQESVTSLKIRGTMIRYLGGRALDFSWEASWQAPDKFVQVETQSITAGPMGTRSTTRRSGFNGDRGIQQTISDLPMPPMPPGRLSDPDALVPRLRGEASRLLLALLASVTPVTALMPSALVETDPAHLPTADAVVVSLEDPDKARVRLTLDPTTRLPAMVSWIDFQIMTFSTTTSMAVSSSGRTSTGQPIPQSMPMPPPSAGPPPKVEYQMALSDYREDKGINWPRRLTVTMAGQAWEEIRISRYEVNPKLSDKAFDVRR